MAEELILTTPSQLKTLLVEAVSIALKYHPIPQPATQSDTTSDAPILSAGQVMSMTGWPKGTFYAKVSEMPEGIVIRGKSKRLLIDREKFMAWLKSPVQP